MFTPNYENVINESDNVKDLGVLIDSKLDHKAQRSKVIAKTNQKAGWVLRTFRSREISHLRRTWRSLIQPHQDYCCLLWAPVSCLGDKLAQEGPLRSYTRKAWGQKYNNYWQRLKAFNLS